MNSSSRFVEVIIVRFTARVTKSHGGRKLALMRWPPLNGFGAKHILFGKSQQARQRSSGRTNNVKFRGWAG